MKVCLCSCFAGKQSGIKTKSEPLRYGVVYGSLSNPTADETGNTPATTSESMIPTVEITPSLVLSMI